MILSLCLLALLASRGSIRSQVAVLVAALPLGALLLFDYAVTGLMRPDAFYLRYGAAFYPGPGAVLTFIASIVVPTITYTPAPIVAVSVVVAPTDACIPFTNADVKPRRSSTATTGPAEPSATRTRVFPPKYGSALVNASPSA